MNGIRNVCSDLYWGTKRLLHPVNKLIKGLALAGIAIANYHLTDYAISQCSRNYLPVVNALGLFATAIPLLLSAHCFYWQLKKDQEARDVQFTPGNFKFDPNRKDRPVLVFHPQYDYNRQFSDTHSSYDGSYNMIFNRWSSLVELEKKVQVIFEQMKIDQPITVAILGHGDGETILGGDPAYTVCGEVRADDLIHLFRSRLPPGSDLVVDSCLAGIKGGLCEQLAKGLKGVRVWGAKQSFCSTDYSFSLNPITQRAQPCIYQHYSKKDITVCYDENGEVRCTEDDIKGIFLQHQKEYVPREKNIYLKRLLSLS